MDADGEPAPRLNDVALSAEQAIMTHSILINEVVKMLCAGTIHGDLSEFNILLGAHGPVIIDLPQAVDAAGNNHAQRMLLRDVNNLRQYCGQFAPAILDTQWGPEIWDLYQRGLLQPDSQLSGQYQAPALAVDLDSVIREIEDAKFAETQRLLRMQT